MLRARMSRSFILWVLARRLSEGGTPHVKEPAPALYERLEAWTR